MVSSNVYGMVHSGSTVTVVRMFYLHTILDGPDFLCKPQHSSYPWVRPSLDKQKLTLIGATTDVAIWSTLEPGIGITAASLAILPLLVRMLLFKSGYSSSPGQSSQGEQPFGFTPPQRRDRRGYTHTLELYDIITTHHEGNISHSASCRTITDNRYSTDLTVTVQSSKKS